MKKDIISTINIPNKMSLSSLPVETQIEILLYLPVKDLINLCSLPSFNSLCQDPYFWKRKFKEEGLLLLEEGQDLLSWIALYKAGRRAKQLASASKIVVDLSRLNKEDLLLPPSVEKDVYLFYLDVAKGRHYGRTKEEIARLEEETNRIDVNALSEESWRDIKWKFKYLRSLMLNKVNLRVELELEGNSYFLSIFAFLRDFEWHIIKANEWEITPRERYELAYKAFYYGLVEESQN